MEWRKSSRSNPGRECVEVAALPDDLVGVRDSKLGDRSPVLAVSPAAFAAFLADLPTQETTTT